MARSSYAARASGRTENLAPVSEARKRRYNSELCIWFTANAAHPRRVPRRAAPVAATIGNFDGVHRGHQAMLARVTAAARELRLASCVLTFEPHPRDYFAAAQRKPERRRAHRDAARQAARLLARCGIEQVRRAALRRAPSPRQRRKPSSTTCWSSGLGRAVRAGRRRLPLRREARRRLRDAAMRPAQRAASTWRRMTATRCTRGCASRAPPCAKRWRAATWRGAAALLGRPYSISGRVVHGDKLGRELGFATANLRCAHEPAAATGIFAVRVHGLGDKPRPGVASLGMRPTVTLERRRLLEVHPARLSPGSSTEARPRGIPAQAARRGEIRGLEALRAQIARDCDAARALPHGRAADV